MKYYLSLVGHSDTEKEVTKEEFMRAERSAGFHSHTPGEPATGGFTGRGVHGRVEYAEDPNEGVPTWTH